MERLLRNVLLVWKALALNGIPNVRNGISCIANCKPFKEKPDIVRSPRATPRIQNSPIGSAINDWNMPT